METSVCTKCEKTKRKELFSKRSNVKSGIRSECKKCVRHNYIDNKDEILSKASAYYEKNKSRIKKKTLEYYNTNKNNEDFKLKKFIRSSLDRILQKAKYESGELDYLFKDTDSDKIKFIVGCNIKEFIFNIESKFTKGMSWKNHGEWHIDHDFPLSKCVELYGPEKSLQLVNHHTNLKPMWANDNRKKSCII